MKASCTKNSLDKLRYIPIFLIVIYQKLISPFLPPSCRFYPSCSDYARQAIVKHGILRGCFVSLVRIVKCHPFHPGGYDPV